MYLRDMPPVGRGEEFPLFKRISVETSKKCNRRCGFCPVSLGHRDGPEKRMDDALWRKVVDELVTLEFRGVMQAFLLNEPTLDPTLPDKLADVRDRLPRVSTYVSTNGDVLAAQKDPHAWLSRMRDVGLRCINLNVYDGGEAGAARLSLYRRLVDEGWPLTRHKYNAHPRGEMHIAITDMRPERVKSDASLTDMWHHRIRDGHHRKPSGYCARTQRHLVVTYDGRVPLCCALDPTDEDTCVWAGDVSRQSLREVWDSDLMRRYRWHTQRADRSLAGCRSCDHRMAYPHLVRLVADPSEEESSEWAEEDAQLVRREDSAIRLRVLNSGDGL